MPSHAPVPTHGLTHVALAVQDPERSLRFYQDVLGVVPVYEIPTPLDPAEGAARMRA